MRILLFASVLCCLFACGGQETPSASDTSLVTNSASAGGESRGDLPEITFEQEVHDFGTITQGERVSTEFAFTNTGTSNLIISDARGSCGCTVPDWPREPVAPGKKGVIRINFDSEGKSGLQEKTVTIVTNCEPATRIIRIKANIEVPQTAG
jgi:hypothetical protein